MSEIKDKKLTMEEITNFCKQKGFVFQGSEIYGGLAGTFDYGHYGVLLKENIKNTWTKSMIQMRDDVFLLDSAIFMHPTTWKASGHIDNFDDPLVDCKKCQNRMRADHLLESFGVNADKQTLEFINQELDKLKTSGSTGGKKLVCTNCGSADLTPARSFSLMVKSNFGSPIDNITEENVVYLRPETCGGIYLQYKNTLDSLHPKLPFGIAQVGKAFRNEIVTKQFIFRTREFEQMEMQYFLHESEMTKHFEHWKNYRWEWYLKYGINPERLKWYKHEKLAHYASDAYDIEYNFYSLGGYKEIEGVHARGNWDLSQHAKFSGVELNYFDEERKERYVPHIMETSTGLARQFLMFIDNAYSVDIQNAKEIDSERVFLKLHKDLAPIKFAILPLLKNKLELTAKAKEIFQTLREKYICEYDESGTIGKRYRRQDEIGTPFCVTVDFQTLDDGTVTIRHRDDARQERIKIEEIEKFML